MRSQRVGESRFVQLPGVLLTGHARDIVPGQRRLQLETTGAARPARFERQRLFIGQRNHRVKYSLAEEVERQGESSLAGAREELAVSGHAPHGKQSANDDSGVEEVCEM